MSRHSDYNPGFVAVVRTIIRLSVHHVPSFVKKIGRECVVARARVGGRPTLQARGVPLDRGSEGSEAEGATNVSQAEDSDRREPS